MKLLFTFYLLAASWQDLRKRHIAVWLYGVFGVIGIIGCVMLQEVLGQRPWTQILLAIVPGLLLLLTTKCSRGAIGAGDGCFFITAAFYMDFWSVSELLFYGLLFCSACCLGIVLWGCIAGVNVRKRRLPFLPFLVPAWIWINILMY